jgi:hypothetical protein
VAILPKPGPNRLKKRAFFLRGQADNSGNLKRFLRNVGRKYGQNSVIWKGDDKDLALLALKEWPALGLRIGDKKNFRAFRTNCIGQYHALLARACGGPDASLFNGTEDRLTVPKIPHSLHILTSYPDHEGINDIARPDGIDRNDR